VAAATRRDSLAEGVSVIRKSLVIGGATGVAAAALVAAMVSGIPASAVSLSGNQQPGDDTNSQIQAMAAGLGLTPGQAKQRIKKQDDNSKKAAKLQAALGTTKSAGAYLDPKTGDLQVNVTTAQAAAQVKAAGATPRLVRNSEAVLDSVKAKLDAVGAKGPAGFSWTVDPTTNAVRLTTLPTTSDKTISAFLAKAGVTGSDTAKISISKTGRKLRAEGLIGGDDTEIYQNNVAQARCSVGFLAIRKSDNVKLMLTAGHCSLVGNQYRRDADKRQIGTLLGYNFGTRGDYSIVSVWHPSLWHPYGGYVNKYTSPFSKIKVTGSTAKAIGSYVCKSGSTSGWTCGYITQKNVTVRVEAEGKIYTVGGLTDSSICSMPGDSGGSVIAGGQAQGMVSAGPANGPTCHGTKSPSGSETLFQPIKTVLSRFGFKLYTTK
jgi:streptogrisin C